MCRWDVPGHEAEVAGPQGEVRLLRVEEERFVPWSTALPAFRADQQGRALGPVGHGLFAVQPPISDDLAQRGITPGPARTDQRVGPGPEHGRLPPHGLDQFRFPVKQLGHGQPGARPERAEQVGNAPRREPDVGVEHENRRMRPGGPYRGVDASGIAGVATHFDHGGFRRQATQHGNAVVGRGVVGHGEMPGHALEPVCQRGEKIGQQRLAVVGNGDDGYRLIGRHHDQFPGASRPFSRTRS